MTTESTVETQNLSNNQLIRHCAQDATNEKIWREFCRRFNERIWLAVYRECREKRMDETSRSFEADVQDLVQEVYQKLLENDRKALKEFKGTSEFSIFLYLGRIAQNVVRNYYKMQKAQKRPQIEKSLDAVIGDFEDGNKIYRKDLFTAKASKAANDLETAIFREEIEEILNKCLWGNNRHRNILIFKLYFFEDLSPEEIAQLPNLKVSEKRVRNIISQIKKLLREKLFEKKLQVL